MHSTLHYCGAAWQPWLAKSNVAILERVQNRALRILTGQLADTPLECLRTEAELTSFETQIRHNCIVAWERSARLPAGNPRHKLFTSPIELKWKRSSFSTLAQAEYALIGLDQFPRDRFSLKKAPPWNWDRDPTWRVNTRLNGGSDKSCDQRTLLTDTVDTIAAAGEVEITIYTDRSAERGYKNGGSAAVVTSGPATDPVKITSITRKGRRLKSSYETEVTAMLLAVGWIKNRENQGPFIICTDNQSTLTALQSPGLSDGSDLAETRRILNSLNTRVYLQWVPGHIGLIGNEWADGEDGAAAASDEEPAAIDGSITFQTAKAFTKRETMDPVEAMLSAAKVNIGKVKATTNDKEWMSREIRDAIRTRNHLRRDIVVNRREWISACRKVQLLSRSSKEDRWREFITSADLSANPNKIWSTIKSLSGKCASSIRNKTLMHNGKSYSTSKANADAFMRRYAAISRLSIPKPERRKNTVRRLLNAPSVAEESCKKFTLTELKSAIGSMKPKGAPGRDRIAPRFIRALGPEALDFLLSINNDSWSHGVSPSHWRVALIVPLLKKGKPSGRGESDRLFPPRLTHVVYRQDHGEDGGESSSYSSRVKRVVEP